MSGGVAFMTEVGEQLFSICQVILVCICFVMLFHYVYVLSVLFVEGRETEVGF